MICTARILIVKEGPKHKSGSYKWGTRAVCPWVTTVLSALSFQKSKDRERTYPKEREKSTPKLKSPAKPQAPSHRVMFSLQVIHPPLPAAVSPEL